MSFSNILGIATLTVWLLFLIQKLFPTKRGFWARHGICEISTENWMLRLLKSVNYIETNNDLYKSTGNLKIGGLYDSGRNVVLVKDLDLAKQILVKDFDHFTNRTFSYLGTNDKSWNNMLVNKVDQEWRDLRSTMSPAFTTGKVRRMFPIIRESAHKLSQCINKIVENNREIKIEELMGNYCMDAITSLAFGIDTKMFKDEKSITAQKAKKLLLKFTPTLLIRAVFFVVVPKWISRFEPPLINAEANEFFTKMILGTIRHREKTGERRNDFLQLLLDAKHGRLKKDEGDAELTTYEKDAQLESDNNSESKKYSVMDDDVIAANCLLFIMGGFDTTKSTIIFASYAITTNPDIQEKLRSELLDAIEENGGEFTCDLVNNNEYLDKVVNEVLRKYPPGVRLERLCTKDYPIPNTKSFIPKGSIVWFPLYTVHFDEKYFPQPHKFDPERFSPEVKDKRHPYAFMPFGHGPRNCIANRFALLMIKAAVASLVLNFHMEPTEKTKFPIKFSDNIGLVRPEPFDLKFTSRKYSSGFS